ncbi:hypothetical protein VPH35_027626 [Triticum aestivum]
MVQPLFGLTTPPRMIEKRKEKKIKNPQVRTSQLPPPTSHSFRQILALDPVSLQRRIAAAGLFPPTSTLSGNTMQPDFYTRLERWIYIYLFFTESTRYSTWQGRRTGAPHRQQRRTTAQVLPSPYLRSNPSSPRILYSRTPSFFSPVAGTDELQRTGGSPAAGVKDDGWW